MSIKKKSKDQTGDNGILATAVGYATKANPDPELATSETLTPSSFAINPRMLKITHPAKTEVLQLQKATVIASLK